MKNLINKKKYLPKDTQKRFINIQDSMNFKKNPKSQKIILQENLLEKVLMIQDITDKVNNLFY